MKKCPICNVEIPEDAEKCPLCGSEIDLFKELEDGYTYGKDELSVEINLESELENLIENIKNSFEEEKSEEKIEIDIDDIIKISENIEEDILPDIEEIETLKFLEKENMSKDNMPEPSENTVKVESVEESSSREIVLETEEKTETIEAIESIEKSVVSEEITTAPEEKITAEVKEAETPKTEEPEIIKCEVCESDIKRDYKECPYCGALFGIKINEEDILKGLLKIVKELIVLSKDIKTNVNINGVMKHVKKAWDYANMEKYKEGIKFLVIARKELEDNISNKLMEKLHSYDNFTKSEPIKILYEKILKYINEKRYREALKELERLEDVSKPIKMKVKKIYDVITELSNNAKLVKRFGVDIGEIESLIEKVTKDLSEGRLNDATEKINVIDKKLENLIKDNIKQILGSIKNYLFAAQLRGIDTKPILIVIRNLKVACEEKNVKEILKLLREMSNILKQWGLLR